MAAAEPVYVDIVAILEAEERRAYDEEHDTAYNPYTGKWVKASGRQGRRLLATARKDRIDEGVSVPIGSGHIPAAVRRAAHPITPVHTEGIYQWQEYGVEWELLAGEPVTLRYFAAAILGVNLPPRSRRSHVMLRFETQDINAPGVFIAREIQTRSIRIPRGENVLTLMKKLDRLDGFTRISGTKSDPLLSHASLNLWRFTLGWFKDPIGGHKILGKQLKSPNGYKLTDASVFRGKLGDCLLENIKAAITVETNDDCRHRYPYNATVRKRLGLVPA